MDSANSGSMQSSSNASDEEFDSRDESISSFLNLPPPSPLPPPLTSRLHHHPFSSSSSFDPLSNYFDSLPRSPPANLNPISFDMTPARALDRLSSSSSPGPSLHSGNTNLTPSTMQPPAPPDQMIAGPRGSKKRSRASRRAPTTVLATDTSNFRAMVQEFTGIPSPPFAASPCRRPRFDLFHAPAPPYLLRPFAHKFHAHSFAPFSSSPMADAIATTNANIPITNTTPTTCSNSKTTSTTNQFPSAHLQLPNLQHMQSPFFTFHSLPQAQTTLPAASNYVAGDLGSLIATEGMHRQPNGLLGWVVGPESDGRDGDQSREFVGICGDSDRVTTCKLNYSAPQPDFHSEKGSESVPASRSEGVVDSWLLASD